ncbi:MAG: hypothetical protein IJ586_07175 [Alloprevotella sp.]|nr:hypothetical protein [Alloprevotella sp.]
MKRPYDFLISLASNVTITLPDTEIENIEKAFQGLKELYGSAVKRPLITRVASNAGLPHTLRVVSIITHTDTETLKATSTKLLELCISVRPSTANQKTMLCINGNDYEI